MLKSLNRIFQALIFRTRSNPFRRIVKDLPETPTIVTTHTLDKIAYRLRKSGVDCTTYGEVIEVLEYLSKNNAIHLECIPGTRIYKIGKLQ